MSKLGVVVATLVGRVTVQDPGPPPRGPGVTPEKFREVFRKVRPAGPGHPGPVEPTWKTHQP